MKLKLGSLYGWAQQFVEPVMNHERSLSRGGVSGQVRRARLSVGIEDSNSLLGARPKHGNA